MRGLILFALMFSVTMSQQAFAGDISIRYSPNTVLPLDAQASIHGQLLESCNYIVEQEWDVEEVKTELHLEPVDQTPKYEIYTTSFVIRAYDLDGMHPFTLSMKMETVVENPYNKSMRVVRVTKLDAGNLCSF